MLYKRYNKSFKRYIMSLQRDHEVEKKTKKKKKKQKKKKKKKKKTL